MIQMLLAASRPRPADVVAQIVSRFGRAYLLAVVLLGGAAALCVAGCIAMAVMAPHAVRATDPLIFAVPSGLCALIAHRVGKRRRREIAAVARDGELVHGTMVKQAIWLHVSAVVAGAEREYIVQRSVEQIGVLTGAVRVLVSEDEPFAIVLTRDGAELPARMSWWGPTPWSPRRPGGELAKMRVVQRRDQSRRVNEPGSGT